MIRLIDQNFVHTHMTGRCNIEKPGDNSGELTKETTYIINDRKRVIYHATYTSVPRKIGDSKMKKKTRMNAQCITNERDVICTYVPFDGSCGSPVRFTCEIEVRRRAQHRTYS